MNATLKECTIFDLDALRGNLSQNRTSGTNLNTIFSLDIPANFADHAQIACRDLCHHVCVSTDCDEVPCEADGTDNRSRNVDRLRSDEFTLDSQVLADHT